MTVHLRRSGALLWILVSAGLQSARGQGEFEGERLGGLAQERVEAMGESGRDDGLEDGGLEDEGLEDGGLEDRGIDLELYYTVDVLSNVSGGVERATEVLGNVDLLLTADMERLLGWEGGTLFLYGLANHGGSISDAVGDVQGVDNIEAPETAKLYEAWYEQVMLDEHFSVLFGLYDVNGEFDVIPAGALFVHSAHGMGSAFGTSGVNGPSTFPATSLAARVHVKPSEQFYFRAVVADGVPGDPDDPQGTQIDLDRDDGLLLAGELGYYKTPSEELRGRTRLLRDDLPAPDQRYGYFGKYAVGVWGYTTDFDDFFATDPSGNPQQNRGSYGVYALAEQHLFYEGRDPSQGLSAFARIGFADDRTNLFDRYLGLGLVYRGPFAGRDDDRLGLAVAAARLGSDYRNSIGSTGAQVDEWEVAIELTYRARVASWLYLQPDVQYVANPGSAPGLDDALIVGARMVLSF